MKKCDVNTPFFGKSFFFYLFFVFCVPVFRCKSWFFTRWSCFLPGFLDSVFFSLFFCFFSVSITFIFCFFLNWYFQTFHMKDSFNSSYQHLGCWWLQNIPRFFSTWGFWTLKKGLELVEKSPWGSQPTQVGVFFKHVFYFYPGFFGKWSNLTSIFWQNGLVQRPTSIYVYI